MAFVGNTVIGKTVFLHNLFYLWVIKNLYNLYI